MNFEAKIVSNSVPRPTVFSKLICPLVIFKLFFTGSSIKYWLVILKSQFACEIACATCEIAELAILVSATLPERLTFSPSSFAFSPHL